MTKIFAITIKWLEPATSCVRDQDATTVSARHMWETGSLNWVQFMLRWLIRFPEFTESTELNGSYTPFKKNTISKWFDFVCTSLISTRTASTPPAPVPQTHPRYYACADSDVVVVIVFIVMMILSRTRSKYLQVYKVISSSTDLTMLGFLLHYTIRRLTTQWKNRT